VSHDFNLVLIDDPVHEPGTPITEDLVAMLDQCHKHVAGVFAEVFDVISRDVREFRS
jgi:hypothetical protein